MKFQKYINEKQSIDSQVDEAVRKIWKDVDPNFIKAVVDEKFLLRATGRRGSDIMMKVKARKDRKPKDTPRIVHEMADEFFEKEFGWKVRSNGVFTISDPHYIKKIHRPGQENFLFFPIGKYKFVWSTSIKDFYTEVSRRVDRSKILGDIYYLTFRERLDGDEEKRLKDIMKDIVGTYNDSNLGKAIDSGKEVAFKCSNYYLIDGRYSFHVYNKLLEGRK